MDFIGSVSIKRLDSRAWHCHHADLPRRNAAKAHLRRRRLHRKVAVRALAFALSGGTPDTAFAATLSKTKIGRKRTRTGEAWVNAS